LHFPVEAPDARGVLAEVEFAVAGGGTDVDARAQIVAGNADGNVVGKAEHKRLIGGLDGPGTPCLWRRRFAGDHPPPELAHGLFHQFEGLLGRAIHADPAQVRIAGLLQGSDGLTGIGRGLGARRVLWRQGLKARGRRPVGRHVIDARQLEKGRQEGERPRQDQERQENAEKGGTSAGVAFAPDPEQ